MYDYDACLIYNHKYRQQVDQIATRLTEEAHLAVVHCIWDIFSTHTYVRDVSGFLDYSATCVVFLHDDYPEPWSFPELRHELERRSSGQETRLILVRLFGSVQEPDLSIGKFVDFSEETNDSFQALEAAIVGATPPVVTYQVPDTLDDLQVEPAISGVFFPLPYFEPRPIEMERMHAFWREETQSGVLALVGSGGSGKTALLLRFLQDLPQTDLAFPSSSHQENLPRATGLYLWSIYDNPNIEHSWAL